MPPLHSHRLVIAVWLRDEVAAILLREAAELAPSETGGILMGYWSTDGAAVVVTNSVPGGPAAVHQRSRFEPDPTWQREEVARLYRTSGRVHTYLGDWHTHPGGSARPSRLDKRTAKTIATAHEARSPRPVFIILSLRDQIEIRAYIFRAGRFRRGRFHIFG